MAPETHNTYDDEGRLIPDGVADPGRAVNSQDLIHAKALEFVRRNKDHPFFLYYATQIPHGPIIAKQLGRFRDKLWDIKHKEWAAMIDHLDRHVGELVECLRENALLDNTIIFFASDNGYEPSYLNNKRYEDDPVFQYKGPWPGGKFSNREGGLRVPFFVYWKGRINPRLSDHITAFYDFLPTAADLAGIALTSATDGISIVPELENRPEEQCKHEYLYWEHDSTIHAQTVRMDRWHAFRPHPNKPMELYDIVSDPECKENLASKQPDIVKRIGHIMEKAHTPSRWFINPGESRESIAAKKERANSHPMPQGRRANGI
jgi:arylsulfatase A-like enzyme